MFNFQGSELIIILLLALVVLGPEKLPDAMRKAGRAYSELKKMATGFQKEFHDALDEPVREVKETADLLRDSADFTKLQDGDRPEKPKSAEMSDAVHLAAADPDAVPVDEVPFSGPPAEPTPPVGSDDFGSLPAVSRPSEPDPAAEPDDGGDDQTTAAATEPSTSDEPGEST